MSITTELLEKEIVKLKAEIKDLKSKLIEKDRKIEQLKAQITTPKKDDINWPDSV